MHVAKTRHRVAFMQNSLLSSYLAGIDPLKQATAGLTREQLTARPIERKWSVLEVVSHLADSEALFAERMKRILAEDRPTLLVADPDLFAPALAYNQRDLETEIGLIELTRKQMASILRTVPDEALTRVGIHSVSGPVTLRDVLTKCTTHLDHHLRFVREKRIALGLPG